jgi:hypothetical protein
MYDVPFIVYHYVLVVPVLHLENVADERISRQRVQESSLGSPKASRFEFTLAVAVHIEVIQRLVVRLPMYLIQAHRVINVVDQPAIRTRRKDLVSLQPQRELLHFEDLLNLADQLHSELLLSHIVVAFDYKAE